MKRTRVTLAVVSVGLVGGWMLWAAGQAHEDARRAMCKDHLKWAIVHLLNYCSRHGHFPSGTIPNPHSPPERRLSWLVEFWDEQCLGERLDVDRSLGWDEAPNWPPKVLADGRATYIEMKPDDVSDWVTCPDDPGYRSRKPFPLTYVGVAGVGVDAPDLSPKHSRAGIFGFNRVTRLEEITDGTATTMAVIETTLGHKPWTAGGLSSVRGVDTTTRPYIGRNRPFGGYHAGGANVAFADGSVRFVRDTIAPNIFEAIATIGGGAERPRGWTP
jgi:prepilin-type processing-associated H-X9-DG protein